MAHYVFVYVTFFCCMFQLYGCETTELWLENEKKKKNVENFIPLPSFHSSSHGIPFYNFLLFYAILFLS